MKRTPLTIDDLLRFRVPTNIEWSPNGRQLACAIEQQQPELEGFHSHVHVYDLRKRTLQALTAGKRRDAQAIWSPDGKWVWFRSVIEGRARIGRIPAGGGEEEIIFSAHAALGQFEMSPDGKWLVFAMRKADPKAPVIAHRFVRADYKEDGGGYRPKDRWGVYALSLRKGGRPRRLSSPRYDAVDPAISPDSRQVAYASNRHPRADLHSEHQELVVGSLRGGGERIVRTPAGPVGRPSWSPDGKLIAYVGHARPDEPWEVVNRHVWVVGRAGRPKARNLTPDWDRSVIDAMVGDVGVFPTRRGALWSGDGRRVFFLASDRGRTQIHSTGLSARAGLRAELPAKAHVKAFALRGRKLALVRADADTPGELRLDGRVLLRPNAFLRRERQLAQISEHWIRCDDGHRIQGWLYRPASSRAKLPAILSIHGGPVAQYGYSFLHELHWLAARGYAIFACNPRGGLGYGEEFARSIVGAWGGRDYEDLMQATDWLCEQSFVDAKRLGVMGGSYGGYMTNWIVAHTRRFRAAITQRCLSDLRAAVGSSDIGHTWSNEFGSAFWDRPELHEQLSPIAHVKNIHTPLLIMHSLADLRVGSEQAELLFTSLRQLGRRTEMMLFPDETHDLSRSGRFARRRARLEAVADWFERHL